MKKFSIWFLLFLILKEARACISSSGAQQRGSSEEGQTFGDIAESLFGDDADGPAEGAEAEGGDNDMQIDASLPLVRARESM